MNNKIPIVLFFFNRKHVVKVLEQIKRYQPKKLYLTADGGRNSNEHLECLRIRKIVDDMIDWDCDVIRKYTDINLGVDVIMPETITEIFTKEEQLIILEDDCVADISFFEYAAILLDKYQFDKRIMGISGTNWFDDISFTDQSYFYSLNFEACGWATWKRSWDLYDNEMKNFKYKNNKVLLKEILRDNFLANQYFRLFKNHYLPALKEDWKNSHWDGKWLYALFVNQGVSIVPNVNLVTNIGFDEMATHTNNSSSFMANKLRKKIAFPLKHNDNIVQNSHYDKLYAKKILGFNKYGYVKESISNALKKFGINS